MKRILIVDDAAFMRMSIRAMLENAAFDIVGEAENGDIAIKKYKELHPDIVTMDITMPIMDGIQAIKEIKKIDSRAIVIMITALGQEHMVKEAVLSGAKGFLVKPFKEQDLLNALSKL
ncbi:response regulator [Petroclostridium sp. X23]|uniref:response regulator n=1 Tax=Petroclostridium sp. X23 TaxID=3045146 RepID=UPI0024ACCEA1|nr:response regulator [Petroclostridium sp. X23]WHH60083.1 response regulator [Petroclostridium sp. X23]